MRIYNQRRVRLARRLDLGLRLLRPLVQRILPPHPPADTGRVLVFEPFLLGDFVMATTAFQVLRRALPSARIECVAPPALVGMEEFFPCLDRIIPFRCPWSPDNRDYSPGNLRRTWEFATELRRRHYDWAFDLRGDVRNVLFLYATGSPRRVGFGGTGGRDWLTDVVPFEHPLYTHQVEGNLVVASHPFGVPEEPKVISPSIRIPENWRRAARAWRDERGIGEFVAVHPGASLPHKRWPVTSWSRLLDDVVLPGLPVVLFATEEEESYVDQIVDGLRSTDHVHRAVVSLRLFFSLVSISRGMISVDSAAAHVAAATNVPVVSVHGPSPASFSRPYSTKSRAVELENVPCRPCLRACTQPRNFCLLDLDVPPVASALKEMGIV